MREFSTSQNELEEGGIYLVSENHTLNFTLDLKANITLIFRGGKIIGNGYLIGNNTSIEAPIVQIFAESLNVSGTWIMDRAYPQWFGAKNDNSINCSDAINKAIEMKNTGEVFLPRGVYKIDKTILLKFGIILTGEAGLTTTSKEDMDKYGATILHPSANSLNNYYGGFMLMINIKNPENVKLTDPENETWEIEYPITGTAIKNIVFQNTVEMLPSDGWEKDGIANLKGILAAGSFELEKVIFKELLQGLVTTYDYADQRKTTGCVFLYNWNKHTPAEGKDYYAFQFTGLGDAFVFENNAIHSTFSKQALYLSYCCGGNIMSNIFNSHVYMNSCRNISFKSNHLEGDNQVRVRMSNASFSDNFFWKNDKPNVVIEGNEWGDKSNVTFNNDQFYFRDLTLKVLEKEAETEEKKELMITNNFRNIHEFDIQIDYNSSVKFINTYRSWHPQGNVEKMHTTGVRICNENNTSIDSFNNQSHLLSSSGSILEGKYVINNHYANTASSIAAYNWPEILNTDNTIWTKENGIYSYSHQIIWDKERKIGGKLKHFNNDCSLQKYGQGAFILISGEGATCGYQTSIRIFRTRMGDDNSYVDIPLSGATNLQDNGYSIHGYKWQPFNGGNPVLETNEAIESIRFKGTNIEC